MAHARQQIRDAFATRLTGLVTTGSRIKKARARDLDADHDPTLFIFTRQETSKPISTAFPRTILRAVTVHVEGRVQMQSEDGIETSEACEDALETIADEVETAVANDPSFGKTVKDCVLVATIKDIEATADRHQGGIRMSYEVTYATKENAPDVLV